ncbi:MAG: tRNA lysidine(34) synthetase TilS [Bacteroidales bacterium]|nr:tRNA lysidine(34) synthetase TilS [Bacteroidales bacterium]
MDLLNKVQSFIEEHSLLDSKDKVLVGFSGGADSLALLSVLLGLGYNCVAVHVNFQLRGEEALRDETFVVDFCRKHSIPVYVERVDTVAYAQSKSVSIEMAARELRYDYFHKMLSKTGAARIAVGHHSDDSIETFFINLLRGSGIRGLKGINPRQAKVIRPLLCVSRQEILSWLKQRNLQYMTDSSNQETLYRRNKIRHQVLPLLESIEPSAVAAILRSMQHLAAPASLYEQTIAEAMKRLKLNSSFQDEQVVFSEKSNTDPSESPNSEEYISLSISALEQEALAPDILFEWLTDYGFDARSIEQIWARRKGQSGKQYSSATHRLLLDRGRFLLNKTQARDEAVYELEEAVTSWTEPVKLNLSILEAGKEYPRSASCACLDADKLKFPLYLRRPLPGDSFMPLGMPGRKLLSDYFCDRKINLFQKESCWLLLSGEDIVWVLGERIDHRYRVTDATKRIYCFSLS